MGTASARAWRWEKVWSSRDHDALSPHGFAALHPSDADDAVHCGGWAEIWSSPDEGKHWSHSGVLGRRGRTYIHAIWSRGAVVYAVGRAGQIYVSGDRGKRWQARSVGTLKDLNGVSGELAGKRTYAVGQGGLAVVSDDAGKTWQRLKTGT